MRKCVLKQAYNVFCQKCEFFFICPFFLTWRGQNVFFLKKIKKLSFANYAPGLKIIRIVLFSIISDRLLIEGRQ